MKIVADENIPLVEEFFSHLGEVVRRPGRVLCVDDVGDADALLVRSVTRVDAALLEASSVKFVGTCTIGVDHLDQAYLRQRGIGYASAPGSNANSVVEYVYTALCALDMDWSGGRVGIIGCGNVGGLLYRRFRAQGVECVCYDPFLTKDQNPDLTSLEEVLTSDIICLHTPLTNSGPYPSFHLLGLKELAQLRQGAILINAGRGPVVDNQALVTFLEMRPDVRLVLDVWEPEPDISPLLLAKVAIATPHIAGYSYDGKLKGTEMIYRALCSHLQVAPCESLGSLVPPLENDGLLLPPGLEGWNAVKEAVKKAYDIAADDRALRQLASDDGRSLGQGFDRLRKEYPIRREFHNYRIEGQHPSSTTLHWLAALGFRI